MRSFLLLLLVSVCAGDGNYLGIQSYQGLQGYQADHEQSWDQRRGENGLGPWPKNDIYSVLQNRGTIDNSWREPGRNDDLRGPGRNDNDLRGPGRNENKWTESGRNDNSWGGPGRLNNNWRGLGRVNTNWRGPDSNDNTWRVPDDRNAADGDVMNNALGDIREIRKDGQLKEAEIETDLTRDRQQSEEVLGRYGERGNWQEGPPRYYQAPGRFGFGFEKRNLRASGLHNPITPDILQSIGYRTPLKKLYFTPLNWRTL